MLGFQEGVALVPGESAPGEVGLEGVELEFHLEALEEPNAVLGWVQEPNGRRTSYHLFSLLPC